MAQTYTKEKIDELIAGAGTDLYLHTYSGQLMTTVQDVAGSSTYTVYAYGQIQLILTASQPLSTKELRDYLHNNADMIFPPFVITDIRNTSGYYGVGMWLVRTYSNVKNNPVCEFSGAVYDGTTGQFVCYAKGSNTGVTGANFTTNRVKKIT